jgi:hypothetical protein
MVILMVVRVVVQVVVRVLVVHPQLNPQGLGSKVVTQMVEVLRVGVVRLKRVLIRHRIQVQMEVKV